MEISRKTIGQLKRIFREISNSKKDPQKKAYLSQARKEINFNFQLYGIKSDKEFAKQNSFCTECACSLNKENECPNCGRKYGW